MSPSGGVISGTGVSGQYFYPAVAGEGTHTITYSIPEADGCGGSVSKDFVVVAATQPLILNEDVTFCENEDQVWIDVSPSGGVISGTGVSGQYFDPAVAGEGTHTITYTIPEADGCGGSVSKDFIVVAATQPLILNEDVTFCENETQVLIDVSPPGGVISGTGVSGQYFDPAVAGEGTHTITYTIPEADGCGGSVSKDFIVVAATQPLILNEDVTFCENETQVLIDVSPSGGVISGTGVSGQYFDPAIAGEGTHTVTYTYTNSTGCMEYTEKQFDVIEKVFIDLGMDRNLDMEDSIELIPYTNGNSFLWFDGSTENIRTLNAKELGVGTHNIWVTAFNESIL